MSERENESRKMNDRSVPSHCSFLYSVLFFYQITALYTLHFLNFEQDRYIASAIGGRRERKIICAQNKFEMDRSSSQKSTVYIFPLYFTVFKRALNKHAFLLKTKIKLMQIKDKILVSKTVQRRERKRERNIVERTRKGKQRWTFAPFNCTF